MSNIQSLTLTIEASATLAPDTPEQDQTNNTPSDHSDNGTSESGVSGSLSVWMLLMGVLFVLLAHATRQPGQWQNHKSCHPL